MSKVASSGWKRNISGVDPSSTPTLGSIPKIIDFGIAKIVQEDEALEVIRVIDRESPRTLRMTGTIGGPVHEDMEIIVRKALEKEPEGRFSSAGDLSDDLGRFLRSEPITARSPSTIYLLRKLVARNRLPFGLAAFFLSALILLTILLAVQLRTTRRERNIAAYEARRAMQFNTIFGHVLNTGEYSGRRKSELLLRDVLAAIDKAVEFEQHTDPQVQANIYYTLGRLYRTIGLHDQAEVHLRHSIEISQQNEGSKSPDLGLALSELSWVKLVLEESDVTAADSLIQLAIEILEGSLGSSSADLAIAVDRLVRIRLAQGRSADAESLATRVVSIRESLYDDDHLALAGAYQMLAWASLTNGKPDKSIELLQSSLEILDRGYPGDHSFKFYVMSILSRQLSDRGESTEAESLAVASVDMARRMLGNDDYWTAWSLRYLAEIRMAAGHYRKAEACYLEALEILDGLDGDVRQDPELCRTGLGHLYLELGDPVRAREHLMEAANAWLKTGDPVRSATTLVDLGRVSIYEGDYEDSERHFERARLILIDLDPPPVFLIARARSGQAELLIRQGRFAEADAILSDGADLASSADSIQATAQLSCTRGRLALARGELSAALNHFRSALEIHTGNEKPSGQLDYVGTLVSLSSCLHLRGNLDEAWEMIQRAVVIMDDRGEELSIHWLDCLEIRAALAMDMGDPGQAQQDLTRCREIRKLRFVSSEHL